MTAISLLAAGSSLADETEDRIKEIRTRYAEIEASGTKQQAIEFAVEGEPVSGTLTRSTKSGKLVKVVLSYTAGDHGGSDERFYFHEGKPVFIHVTDSSWRFGGKFQPNGEPGTIDEATEFRIYLHEGKVIRNLSKNATIESNGDLAKALEKAENNPSTDREREAEILSHASKVSDVNDAEAIIKMLEQRQ